MYSGEKICLTVRQSFHVDGESAKKCQIHSETVVFLESSSMDSRRSLDSFSFRALSEHGRGTTHPMFPTSCRRKTRDEF
jgi:hypothetical protein